MIMWLKPSLHWYVDFLQFQESLLHDAFLSHQVHLIWLTAQDALFDGLNMLLQEPSAFRGYLLLEFMLSFFYVLNFYMIRRDKNRTFLRVLKIDRLEPSELYILEDSTTYSESECCDLLRRIHEGNKSTGGLKFVTTCYGIVGKFNTLVWASSRPHSVLSWSAEVLARSKP
ncbi:uncharacterized protein LOC110665442 isoform X2 [Hevea brasiliensis]|uniref:uncharacterized protein LOC110665442 isoform X2 n=1 Tax=Hevea brasiliensis TaxID=3981 RepID=UPI002600E993|nr:uncharacterized protein LOC110665442 isoform X2 [Hevea brasiliensis]